MTGLRGEGYVLKVLPPVGYGKPRPLHVDRPSGSTVWNADFLLDYEVAEPDERFSRVMWNQLLFNAYECPTSDDCEFASGDPWPEIPDRPLFILSDPAPNFYIVTDGFSRSEIRDIEEAIPGTVVTLSGAPGYYGTIETGRDRDDIEGWITVRAGAPEGDEEWCGRAFIGASSGSITLDPDSHCDFVPMVRHEIGHAMGLFHVEDDWALMSAHEDGQEYFSFAEMYHANLAYQHWRWMQYREGPQMPSPPPPTPGVASGYVITCHR